MDHRRRRRLLALIALSLSLTMGVAGVLGAPIQAPAVAQTEAPRDRGAEQFIQVQGQRLISILADKSQDTDDRIRAFRAAVDEVSDAPYITKFVLGKYARTITPDQMQRFAAVFQDYAQAVYEKQLAHFDADTLTVTGSLARKPGNVLVETTLTGGAAKRPTKLSWRVRGSGSDWKLVDVEVEGLSLAFSQRQDFVSTIDDNDGDIDALIEQLARQRPVVHSRDQAQP